MERVELERMLGEGLSMASIGRRTGLHESTVGYWVQRHGLRPAHKEKSAAKGALTRDDLSPLVEAGLSTGQIAERLGRSKTTVRHWLREYGIETVWASRRIASAEGERRLVLVCQHHGSTEFTRRASGGFRCNKCRAEAVSRRRRKVKRILVRDAGGACVLCGYDRCVGALEFHHVEPSEKRFALSHRGVARSLDSARAEAAKCILRCANCHAEVEAGLTSVPSRAGLAYNEADPGHPG